MYEMFNVRTQGRVVDTKTTHRGLRQHKGSKYRDAYLAMLMYKHRVAMGLNLVDVYVEGLLHRTLQRKIVTDDALVRLASRIRDGVTDGKPVHRKSKRKE